MPANTKFDYVFDDDVAGNSYDFKLSPVVPAGKTVTLLKFGGFAPVIADGTDGLIALQWGNASAWETVRAAGRFFDFDLKKDFIGDGVNRFRLMRQNKSTATKPMVVWLEAIVRDAE
jgi:hypothetical protein